MESRAAGAAAAVLAAATTAGSALDVTSRIVIVVKKGKLSQVFDQSLDEGRGGQVEHLWVPSADLAIFGPHALRVVRKLRLTGMVLGPIGNCQVQLRTINGRRVGQCTAQPWPCWSAPRSSAVDSYRDHVRQNAVRQSTERRALVYQTDTSARRELAEGQQVVHPFDTNNPWHTVHRDYDVTSATLPSV